MVNSPESWATMALSDAVFNIAITDKKIPQKEFLREGAYPVVDQGQEYIGGYTDKKDKLVECELPVIIFGDHTRVIKFVSQPFAPGADGVKVLQPKRFYDPKLLEYFVRHIAANLTSHGYARHYQHLVKSSIPLPPLNEQRRIVAKIEELFSELDKGIENLKIARAQLKVYRQTLLKHAFEGKLTAQWRAENHNKLETAEALLKRIQTERTQCYKQQLADWEIAGRQGGKPKAPIPLTPLTDEELGELPELPKGWGWVKYGDVCSIVRNGVPEKPNGTSGTPIFRISAVRPMVFDMEDIRYIDNSTGRFNAYYLERGDLAFTRYNGSRHYVGVCAEYKSDEMRLFPDKLIQTRIFSNKLLSSYFEKALNSGASRQFIESKIRTTAGQAGVSGDDIKNVPVPVCSTNEQAEIVTALESKLSAVDQLDQTITTALQQAEALRQSILKKAFSGQLVPQDPNDEPASALMARIKAQKIAHATKAKRA